MFDHCPNSPLDPSLKSPALNQPVFTITVTADHVYVPSAHVP